MGGRPIRRYYIEGREGFQEYLAKDVKTKYPFLDTESSPNTGCSRRT